VIVLGALLLTRVITYARSRLSASVTTYVKDDLEETS